MINIYLLFCINTLLQISIKLVLYYRNAYEHLYKSIVMWIQNPFAPMCEEAWPNIEDVSMLLAIICFNDGVGADWSKFGWYSLGTYA